MLDMFKKLAFKLLLLLGLSPLYLGLVYGWKLTNKFGIFLEGRYLNMYDVQSYESKVGFNWLIY